MIAADRGLAGAMIHGAMRQSCQCSAMRCLALSLYVVCRGQGDADSVADTAEMVFVGTRHPGRHQVRYWW